MIAKNIIQTSAVVSSGPHGHAAPNPKRHRLHQVILVALIIAATVRLVSRADAEDRYWVGYQNDCMLSKPDTASYFDADNWYNFRVPQAGDRVILGSAYDPQEDGYPNHIYFGDACLNVPSCSVGAIFGGTAKMGRLDVQSDAWSLNLSTLALGPCDLPGVTTGGLWLGDTLGVGAIIEGSGAPGFAHLTLVGPGNVHVQSPDGHCSVCVAWGDSTAGQLNLKNGVVLTSRYLSVIGDFGFGSLSVAGPGTKWIDNGQLWVGQGISSYGRFQITDGGYASTGYIGIVGAASGGSGEVLVSGPGSTWEVLVGGVWLGNVGSGALRVANGGQLIVHDAGIEVGRTGYGEFALESEASAVSGAGAIGVDADIDGLVVVSGLGSTWTVAHIIWVGYGGHGDLHVQDGGVVQVDRELNVAEGETSLGNLIVAGEGSTAISADHLRVGRGGRGNLTVTDSAAVECKHLSIGQLSTGVGEVTVGGRDSLANVAEQLMVGEAGEGQIAVNDRALVSCFLSHIGSGADASGSAVVSGLGSRLQHVDHMIVGHEGDGKLNVESRALVSNTWAHIAEFEMSNGDVTIKGFGSEWENTDHLIVGVRGVGRLAIESGGQVTNTWGRIGDQTGSVGEVTVDGVGSAWICDGFLDVGHEGTGTLSVTGGGFVAAHDFHVKALGTLAGDGTIHATIENRGAVRPGQHGRPLLVDGAFVQQPEGRLHLSVGANTADQLVIAGYAYFNGLLSLDLQPDFELGYGESVRIIACDAVHSRFDRSAGFHLDNGSALVASYQPDGVWLTTTRAGDFNGNSVIELLDAQLFIAATAGPQVEGVAPHNTPADFSDDDHVDLRDFAAFQNAYGSTL